MGGFPRLTIIVPAYNAEGTILRCLDSLVAQGSGEFSVEIIVVDDGSTDETAYILTAYAVDHPNVRVVSVENGGPSKARNIGLARATGRWVAFCDSDDWVDAGCYWRLIERAERLGVGVAVFGYKNVRPGSTRTHARKIARVVNASELAERCLLDPCVQGFSWNKLYLRELTERERFPEDVWVCEDLSFNINFCDRNSGTKVALLAGAPYNYDLTGESLTRSDNVGEDVMSVLENMRGKKGVESAVRGSLYSNAVKTAFETCRGGVSMRSRLPVRPRLLLQSILPVFRKGQGCTAPLICASLQAGSVA